VIMQCLRSFLIKQAGIKACASAPISLLLLSSALRRRPGSHRKSIYQWFLVAPACTQWVTAGALVHGHHVAPASQRA
jgi:hypothetical protein